MHANQCLFEVGRPSLPSRVTVFASGANESREIRGFALAGVPVGFAASNVRQHALAQLLIIEGPIFADSGAFTEVSFASGCPRVVSPISHEDWLKRLAIYRWLAEVHGSNLLAVAPDMVGNQDETLSRLARYSAQLQEIAAYGAHILIPVQNGALSPAQFYRLAVETSGLPLVPAMPMKKAATPHGALIDFIHEVRPDRLHLLGCGYERPGARKLVRRILAASPTLELSLDSNRLRAVTGSGRAMTILERRMRDEGPALIYAEAESEALSGAGVRLDYTESIHSPSTWATESQLRQIATDSGFNQSETDQFVRNPDRFLHRSSADSDCAFWEIPMVAFALDQAWDAYVRSKHLESVRVAAIRRTFNDSIISRSINN